MDGEQETVERDVLAEAGPDRQSEAESVVPGDFEEHPELFVGAAFAGGFLVALILRRLRG